MNALTRNCRAQRSSLLATRRRLAGVHNTARASSFGSNRTLILNSLFIRDEIRELAWTLADHVVP